MAKQLFGKAPLSLVRTASGSVVYVYGGAPVPAGADDADVARLVDEGFLVYIGEDEPEEKQSRRSSRARSSKPAASDGQGDGQSDGEERGDDGEAEGDESGGDADDGPPLKAAGKDKWVDFAVSKRGEGVSEEDARSQAEALTKNELIKRFGA